MPFSDADIKNPGNGGRFLTDSLSTSVIYWVISPKFRQTTAMKSILILHGPNLNLLGSREPEIYGSDTLADIDGRLLKIAAGSGVSCASFQTNSEGDLINRIHTAKADAVGFIVINPGAFTHTSIALRDALLAANIPFIEIHMSNVHAREPFRQHSYLSDKAVGVICGLGASGYEFALNAAIKHLSR